MCMVNLGASRWLEFSKAFIRFLTRNPIMVYEHLKLRRPFATHITRVCVCVWVCVGVGVGVGVLCHTHVCVHRCGCYYYQTSY